MKLLIDDSKFLDLQRKLPDSYTHKRLAMSVPVTCFDDYVDEAEILSKVIEQRRSANV